MFVNHHYKTIFYVYSWWGWKCHSMSMWVVIVFLHGPATTPWFIYLAYKTMQPFLTLSPPTPSLVFKTINLKNLTCSPMRVIAPCVFARLSLLLSIPLTWAEISGTNRVGLVTPHRQIFAETLTFSLLVSGKWVRVLLLEKNDYYFPKKIVEEK